MNKQDHVGVTIITPAFCRVAGLKRAIESVDAQTYQDWQHLIVHDGPAPLEEFAVVTAGKLLQEPGNHEKRMKLNRHGEAWQTANASPLPACNRQAVSGGSPFTRARGNRRWCASSLPRGAPSAPNAGSFARAKCRAGVAGDRRSAAAWISDKLLRRRAKGERD